MNKNKIPIIIGMIGFSISIILIMFFNMIIVKLTYFAETYISQDHEVSFDTIYAMENYLSFIIFIILTLSIIYILYIKKLLFNSNYIDWNKAKSFFFTDDICNKKKLST